MHRALREPESVLKAHLQRSLRRGTRRNSQAAVAQLGQILSAQIQVSTGNSRNKSKQRKMQQGMTTTRRSSINFLTRMTMILKMSLCLMQNNSKNLLLRKKRTTKRIETKGRMRMMITMRMTEMRTILMRKRCLILQSAALCALLRPSLRRV